MSAVIHPGVDLSKENRLEDLVKRLTEKCYEQQFQLKKQHDEIEVLSKKGEEASTSILNVFSKYMDTQHSNFRELSHKICSIEASIQNSDFLPVLEDDNNLFHAIFGEWDVKSQVFVCKKAEDVRVCLTKKIKEATEGSPISLFILEALEAILEETKEPTLLEDGAIKSLCLKYRDFREQNKELVTEAWGKVEALLLAEHKELCESIMVKYRNDQKLKTFEQQFYDYLTVQSATMKKVLASNKPLKELLDLHKDAKQKSFNLNKFVFKDEDKKVLSEYAENILNRKQKLSFRELKMIAIIFEINIKIKICNDKAQPSLEQELNPQVAQQVGLRYDGVKFERVRSIQPKLDNNLLSSLLPNSSRGLASLRNCCSGF